MKRSSDYTALLVPPRLTLLLFQIARCGGLFARCTCNVSEGVCLSPLEADATAVSPQSVSLHVQLPRNQVCPVRLNAVVAQTGENVTSGHTPC